MVAISAITLFALPALLLPVSAIPTRTHCRCTIIDANKLASSNLLSSDPVSRPDDLCSHLGPELEHFRQSKPDVYRTFIRSGTVQEPTPTDEEEKPISTTVLLQIAAENGFENLGTVLPSVPIQRPQERIICRSELEAFSTYEDSRTTLFALQVIVGIAVFACLAEAVSLISSWFERRNEEKPALRLQGTERLLRADPAPESIFSPGAEKKLRVYAAANWSAKRYSGKREFEAFEDDDDEMNRPVM